MGFGWCMNKIFQAHYNRNLWPSSSCLSSFKMLPFLFCLLRFFSTFSHSTWESLVVVYHLAETGMVFFSDKEVSVMRRVPEPVILKQDCFPESLKILTGSFFFFFFFFFSFCPHFSFSPFYLFISFSTWITAVDIVTSHTCSNEIICILCIICKNIVALTTELALLLSCQTKTHKQTK